MLGGMIGGVDRAAVGRDDETDDEAEHGAASEKTKVISTEKELCEPTAVNDVVESIINIIYDGVGHLQHRAAVNANLAPFSRPAPDFPHNVLFIVSDFSEALYLKGDKQTHMDYRTGGLSFSLFTVVARLRIGDEYHMISVPVWLDRDIPQVQLHLCLQLQHTKYNCN